MHLGKSCDFLYSLAVMGCLCPAVIIIRHLFILKVWLGFCSQVLPCSLYLCWFDMYLFSLIRLKEPEFANKDTGLWLLNLNGVSRTQFNT